MKKFAPPSLVITFRLSPELLHKLDASAKNASMTRAEMLRRMIEIYDPSADKHGSSQ
ncbi:ribbon-helix-helix protein, CopG family [Komagataeibacter kakiaceti]|uniref:ribbon-helix-helix protein, CopG family n=1 Tax=Komagataeibacter kakiaceti TaxID=943261 RepID=UPI000A049CDA